MHEQHPIDEMVLVDSAFKFAMKSGNIPDLWQRFQFVCVIFSKIFVVKLYIGKVKVSASVVVELLKRH